LTATEILPENELHEALNSFVEKDEKNALVDFVGKVLESTQKYLVEQDPNKTSKPEDIEQIVTMQTQKKKRTLHNLQQGGDSNTTSSTSNAPPTTTGSKDDNLDLMNDGDPPAIPKKSKSTPKKKTSVGKKTPKSSTKKASITKKAVSTSSAAGKTTRGRYSLPTTQIKKENEAKTRKHPRYICRSQLNEKFTTLFRNEDEAQADSAPATKKQKISSATKKVAPNSLFAWEDESPTANIPTSTELKQPVTKQWGSRATVTKQ